MSTTGRAYIEMGVGSLQPYEGWRGSRVVAGHRDDTGGRGLFPGWVDDAIDQPIENGEVAAVDAMMGCLVAECAVTIPARR